MARLGDKVQSALDELRMLVVGLQVLIGFGYRAALEPGFAELPRALQLVKLASLSLLLLALALVIAPGADHRLCERGQDTPAFHRLTTRFASLALLPLAIAISLDFAVAAHRAAGSGVAWMAAAAVAVVTLGLWYGIELVARSRKGPMATKHRRMEKSTTRDKIHHVLTEARVVLPGAQALLGFQFASTLIPGFDKLPQAMKWLHLASLSAVALSTILLITPAAWHRLVERGEETEGFHRFASAMLLAALVPLALGLGGDFYLVADKITGSPLAAALMAGALGVIFMVLWFGIGVGRRIAFHGHPLRA